MSQEKCRSTAPFFHSTNCETRSQQARVMKTGRHKEAVGPLRMKLRLQALHFLKMLKMGFISLSLFLLTTNIVRADTQQHQYYDLNVSNFSTLTSMNITGKSIEPVYTNGPVFSIPWNQRIFFHFFFGAQNLRLNHSQSG